MEAHPCSAAGLRGGSSVFGHQWEPAEGECVNIRYKGAGNAAKTVNAIWYLMDVRPSAGESFRVEVRPPSLMTSFKSPIIGQVVRMECDPARKKARFDRSDPALSNRTDKQAAKAEYEAQLHGDQEP
jgi:hypothetical protein